jgi:hypothetical protein
MGASGQIRGRGRAIGHYGRDRATKSSVPVRQPAQASPQRRHEPDIGERGDNERGPRRRPAPVRIDFFVPVFGSGEVTTILPSAAAVAVLVLPSSAARAGGPAERHARAGRPWQGGLSGRVRSGNAGRQSSRTAAPELSDISYCAPELSGRLQMRRINDMVAPQGVVEAFQAIAFASGLWWSGSGWSSSMALMAARAVSAAMP